MKHSALRLRFIALTFIAALALSIHAQDRTAPARVPGDFDPSPGQAARPRQAVARPRLQAHSARDDQGQWTPTDFAKANPNLPTLVVAGDSTAATGNPTHRGWAAVLVDYFDTNQVNVINRARGGRSFRTFYGEGLWKQIVDALKPGDFVVIEFGHNDGGGAHSPTGRGDVPGTGDETEEVTKRDGTKEMVHTYGWYERTFIRDTKARGATPIVSSPTVRDIWSNPNAKFRDATIVSQSANYDPAKDRIERRLGRMFDWAKEVAEQEHVTFLNHSDSTADLLEKIGREQASKYFPADHTHTSTDGAIVNAETLIACLKAVPNMPLVNFLNDKGKAIQPWKSETPTK